MAKAVCRPKICLYKKRILDKTTHFVQYYINSNCLTVHNKNSSDHLILRIKYHTIDNNVSGVWITSQCSFRVSRLVYVSGVWGGAPAATSVDTTFWDTG